MTTTPKTYGVDMSRRIEAYESAMQSAREAYEAATRPAWEAYEAAVTQAEEAYEAATQPAWEAYEAATRPAWGALACDNPLVGWIIANCATCKSEALEILRALPADLDTLDDIASDAGWCTCTTWEDLRDEAIRAGVISR